VDVREVEETEVEETEVEETEAGETSDLTNGATETTEADRFRVR
jgi:hypothetical protein